jgi:hypothetical protein
LDLVGIQKWFLLGKNFCCVDRTHREERDGDRGLSLAERAAAREMGQSGGALDELGQLGCGRQQFRARMKGRICMVRAWLRAHDAKGDLFIFYFSEFRIQMNSVEFYMNYKTKQTTN